LNKKFLETNPACGRQVSPRQSHRGISCLAGRRAPVSF